jgi:hypothetical protein
MNARSTLQSAIPKESLWNILDLIMFGTHFTCFLFPIDIHSYPAIGKLPVPNVAGNPSIIHQPTGILKLFSRFKPHDL